MAYRYSSRTRWDLVWKEALTQFFQPAMEFLFPRVAADIDWSHPVEILDRELRTLLRDTRARRGKTRFVDHLVRTRRLSGEFEAMLVHLEIQVQPQVAFERRVYRYHSWLTAAHEEIVATLVVLGDDDPNWRPTEYQRDYPGGGSAYLRYPTSKLLDREPFWEELCKSDNVFALFVAAHLKALRTRRRVGDRLNWKKHLTLILANKSFDERTKTLLFQFLDTIMSLPYEPQQEFIHWADRLQEVRQMRLITPTERVALKAAYDQGRIEATQEILLTLGEERMGACPPDCRSRIEAISSRELLLQLRRRLESVESWEELPIP